MNMPIGQLESTDLKGNLAAPIQAYRARVNFGLRTRPLGSGTIEVTGGAAGTDTFDPQVNGVSLVSAPVAWTTSHADTAAAIATAINANYAAHNYLATVSSATVTVMQRTSGAITGSLATVVVGDAATTDTDFSNDTDTWTEFVSGATFDGNLYYELSFSGSLLTVAGLAATDLRAVDLDFYCDGQGVSFWHGGLRTASNVIVQGMSLATATWLHATFGSYWPILDPSIPFIIKVASDEELLYSVGVI